MDWYNVLNNRRNNIKPLEDEIKHLRIQEKRIQKKIKAVGTVDICELLCELIETIYGCKSTITSFKGSNTRLIEIYKKSSTYKQVRYKRQECVIGNIWIVEYKGEYYIDETMHDSPTFYIPLPHEIEHIFKYATNDEFRKTIKDKYLQYKDKE